MRTCSRCHRDEPAGGQAYCRGCHSTIQAEFRERRRRELVALRELVRVAARYLDHRADAGTLHAAVSQARALRPVRPYGVLR
jgi:hypothetical protein